MNQEFKNYQDVAEKIDVGADLLEQDYIEVEAIAAAAEAGDKGAPFEPSALQALRAFKVANTSGYMRLRDRLKKAGVGITDLEWHIKHGDGAAPQDDDQSVADKLIELARGCCTFIHDAQNDSYAVFDSGSARQVHRLGSSGFNDFMSHSYYKEFDRAPTDTSLKVALATLRGQALFDGERCEVFTRIAKTDDACYWLDLCNDEWECIKIAATGWTVVKGDGAPLFTRTSSMRPLPRPLLGGTLDDLWPLINVPEEYRLMIMAWLVECLRADTPHVVLELVGEQGSIKSTTQRILRQLIDPNQADLRSAPKTIEDVWVAARNSHFVSLENLSIPPAQYQDALCVLATGGGYSARTLYTNAEETILELRKPIMVNGISVIVTAQDLLDRSLHIDLPTVTMRELSSVIEDRFTRAQPGLVGALLSLFVDVLKMLPNVNIAPENRPRMADFANLGEAVYRIHGRKEGDFLAHFNDIRKAGVMRTIDASPVGAALLAFLSTLQGDWYGGMSELLAQLERYRPYGESGWPRTGKGMGDAMRRLAPGLRTLGYEARSEGKTGGSTKWRISAAGKKPSKPSPASPAMPAIPNTSAANDQKVGLSRLAGLGFRNIAPKK